MSQESAIKRQVEFYFSDSNFRKDTFLRAAADSDPEGFVSISVLLTFNQLKKLTTDVASVAAALESSETVVLNDAKDKVKRSVPLPEIDTSAKRTLYVKGYPIDDPDVTIESVRNQFSAFGKVNMVKLRKNMGKTLKGSALVEFSTEEEMLNALKETCNPDGTISLSFKGKNLTQICTHDDWINEKQTQITRNDKRKRDASESDSAEPVRFESGLVFEIHNIPSGTTALQLKQFFKLISNEVKFVDLVDDNSATLRLGDKTAASSFYDVTKNGVDYKGENSNTSTLLSVKVLEGEAEQLYWQKFAASMRAKAGGNQRNKFKRQRR